MRNTITPAVLLFVAAMSLGACDSNVPTVPVFVTYAPAFNAATMQTNVTNQYFPLSPGTVWTYEEETEDGLERNIVEVLGEDSKEIANGQVVSTAGSWEHGVRGAMAGIVMPANPSVGQAYQQEFYEGEAEDRGKVVSVNESVTTPAGSFSNCIKTEDTTPLEPNVLENKYYCPGVGTVLELDVASGTRVELLTVEMP
jgi:hypothetical protein